MLRMDMKLGLQLFLISWLPIETVFPLPRNTITRLFRSQSNLLPPIQCHYETPQGSKQSHFREFLTGRNFHPGWCHRPTPPAPCPARSPTGGVSARMAYPRVTEVTSRSPRWMGHWLLVKLCQYAGFRRRNCSYRSWYKATCHFMRRSHSR